MSPHTVLGSTRLDDAMAAQMSASLEALLRLPLHWYFAAKETNSARRVCFVSHHPPGLDDGIARELEVANAGLRRWHKKLFKDATETDVLTWMSLYPPGERMKSHRDSGTKSRVVIPVRVMAPDAPDATGERQWLLTGPRPSAHVLRDGVFEPVAVGADGNILLTCRDDGSSFLFMSSKGSAQPHAVLPSADTWTLSVMFDNYAKLDAQEALIQACAAACDEDLPTGNALNIRIPPERLLQIRDEAKPKERGGRTHTFTSRETRRKISESRLAREAAKANVTYEEFLDARERGLLQAGLKEEALTDYSAAGMRARKLAYGRKLRPPKTRRKPFAKEQIDAMTAAFAANPYRKAAQLCDATGLSAKQIGKWMEKKRSRTGTTRQRLYSKEQIDALTAAFAANRYPKAEELCDATGLSAKQIDKWMDNKRYTTKKRLGAAS